MGGRIVKMLGGRQLGRVFAGEIHAVLLDELDKAMQLGGDEECIYRIGKYKQIRRPQSLLRLGETFFYCMDPGTDVQVTEFYLFEMFFNEQGSLKCDAVFPGWGTIDDEYLHFCPPLASLESLTTR